MSISGGLMGLLNETPAAANVTSTAITKRITPQTHKVKAPTQVLPQWQNQLASAFLMTPDMTKDPLSEDVNEDNEDSESTLEDRTQCICGSTNESDVMIQCNSCKNWLHDETCIRLQNADENDPFICLYCQYQLSKSVKRYVRNQFSSLLPIIQQLHQEAQAVPNPHPSVLYEQVNKTIAEIQEVLDLIPNYLPTPDKTNPN